MKHLLTIISCLLALNLMAQEVVVEYPYNPDFENDGNVGVEDLMQLLASFGMGFDVEEINIDEVALSEWLQAISETLIAQQGTIDSLMNLEIPVFDIEGQIDSIVSSFGGMQTGPSKNFEFPDPLNGVEPVHGGNIVVPEGKNLYITSFSGQNDNSELHVNSNVIFQGAGNGGTSISDPSGQLALPIIIGPMDTVSVEPSWGGVFSGFLCDKQVEAVNLSLYGSNLGLDPNHYEIPGGKLLVILNLHSSVPWGLYINDVISTSEIISGYFNYYDESLTENCSPGCYSKSLQSPILLGSNQTILKGPSGATNINGYLIDLDYFSSTETNLLDIDLGPCQGEQSVNYHGYEYDLVEIGDQCWFAEDLQTSTFSNGDEIEQNWNWANFEDPWAMPSCEDHGGWIYNGPARIDERNLCPTDFRMPNESDWSELMGELFGQHLTAGHMNHSGINLHWGHQDYNNDAVGDCVDLSVGGGYYGLEYDQVVLPQGTYSTYTGAYVLGNQWEYLEATEALGMFIRCIRD